MIEDYNERPWCRSSEGDGWPMGDSCELAPGYALGDSGKVELLVSSEV